MSYREVKREATYSDLFLIVINLYKVKLLTVLVTFRIIFIHSISCRRRVRPGPALAVTSPRKKREIAAP